MMKRTKNEFKDNLKWELDINIETWRHPSQQTKSGT